MVVVAAAAETPRGGGRDLGAEFTELALKIENQTLATSSSLIASLTPHKIKSLNETKRKQSCVPASQQNISSRQRCWKVPAVIYWLLWFV